MKQKTSNGPNGETGTTPQPGSSVSDVRVTQSRAMNTGQCRNVENQIDRAVATALANNPALQQHVANAPVVLQPVRQQITREVTRQFNKGS